MAAISSEKYEDMGPGPPNIFTTARVLHQSGRFFKAEKSGGEDAVSQAESLPSMLPSMEDMNLKLSMLEDEVLARSRDLDHLKQEIISMKTHTQSIPSAVDHPSSMKANSGIQSQSAEIDRLKKDKKVMTDLLKQSHKELTKRDSTINQLKQEIGKLRKMLFELQAKLSNQQDNEHLKEQLHILKTENHKMQELCKEYFELQDELQSKRKSLDYLEEKNRLLEDLFEENEQLKDCLFDIYSKLKHGSLPFPEVENRTQENYALSSGRDTNLSVDNIKNAFQQFWEKSRMSQRELQTIKWQLSVEEGRRHIQENEKRMYSLSIESDTPFIREMLELNKGLRRELDQVTKKYNGPTILKRHVEDDQLHRHNKTRSIELPEHRKFQSRHSNLSVSSVKNESQSSILSWKEKCKVLESENVELRREVVDNQKQLEHLHLSILEIIHRVHGVELEECPTNESLLRAVNSVVEECGALRQEVSYLRKVKGEKDLQWQRLCQLITEAEEKLTSKGRNISNLRAIILNLNQTKSSNIPSPLKKAVLQIYNSELEWLERIENELVDSNSKGKSIYLPGDRARFPNDQHCEESEDQAANRFEAVRKSDVLIKNIVEEENHVPSAIVPTQTDLQNVQMLASHKDNSDSVYNYTSPTLHKTLIVEDSDLSNITNFPIETGSFSNIELLSSVPPYNVCDNAKINCDNIKAFELLPPLAQSYPPFFHHPFIIPEPLDTFERCITFLAPSVQVSEVTPSVQITEIVESELDSKDTATENLKKNATVEQEPTSKIIKANIESEIYEDVYSSTATSQEEQNHESQTNIDDAEVSAKLSHLALSSPPTDSVQLVDPTQNYSSSCVVQEFPESSDFQETSESSEIQEIKNEQECTSLSNNEIPSKQQSNSNDNTNLITKDVAEDLLGNDKQTEFQENKKAELQLDAMKDITPVTEEVAKSQITYNYIMPSKEENKEETYEVVTDISVDIETAVNTHKSKDSTSDFSNVADASVQVGSGDIALLDTIEELETAISERHEVEKQHMLVACDMADKVEQLRETESSLKFQLNVANETKSKEIESVRQSYCDEIAAWKENVEQQNALLQKLKQDLDDAQTMLINKEDQLAELEFKIKVLQSKSGDPNKNILDVKDTEIQTSSDKELSTHNELQKHLQKLSTENMYYFTQLQHQKQVLSQVKLQLHNTISNLGKLKAAAAAHIQKEKSQIFLKTESEKKIQSVQEEMKKMTDAANEKELLIKQQENKISKLSEQVKECEERLETKTQILGDLYLQNERRRSALLENGSQTEHADEEEEDCSSGYHTSSKEMHSPYTKQVEYKNRVQEKTDEHKFPHLTPVEREKPDYSAHTPKRHRRSLIEESEVWKILKLSEQSYLGLVGRLVHSLGIKGLRGAQSVMHLSWPESEDVVSDRRMDHVKLVDAIEQLKSEASKRLLPNIQVDPELMREVQVSVYMAERGESSPLGKNEDDNHLFYLTEVLKKAQESLEKDKLFDPSTLYQDSSRQKRPSRESLQWGTRSRKVPLELKNAKILALLEDKVKNNELLPNKRSLSKMEQKMVPSTKKARSPVEVR